MSAIYTNSVWAYRFTLTDPVTGGPYNLSGKSLEMHFKVAPGMPKLLGATTSNGKLTINGNSSNLLDVTLWETDTAPLPPGSIHFDVLWTNYAVNRPIRLFGGRILVREGVTISGG